MPRMSAKGLKYEARPLSLEVATADDAVPALDELLDIPEFSPPADTEAAADTLALAEAPLKPAAWTKVTLPP